MSSRRLLLSAAGAAALVALGVSSRANTEPHVIPPFAEPPTAGAAGAQSPSLQVAVLAGGCFWGVQGVFQHVKGVVGAVSGYAGGEKRTATYEAIGTGRTGHAESVQVTFDPRQISYARLLQIFFSVAHDPTQLDRQGPDTGPQYRSAVFPVDDEQARVARAYIAQLTQSRAFGTPIVTRVEAGRAFYPAEDYHQDFMTRNPTHGYIVVNDLPKIGDLRRIFPGDFREEPVLVVPRGRSG